MEYFKKFIEKIPNDVIELNKDFYIIETDLVIFKNKFTKK